MDTLKKCPLKETNVAAGAAAFPLKKTISSLREALFKAFSEVTFLRAENQALKQELGHTELEELKRQLREASDDLQHEQKKRARRMKAYIDSLVENGLLAKELRRKDREWKESLVAQEEVWRRTVQGLRQQLNMSQKGLLMEDIWRRRGINADLNSLDSMEEERKVVERDAKQKEVWLREKCVKEDFTFHPKSVEEGVKEQKKNEDIDIEGQKEDERGIKEDKKNEEGMEKKGEIKADQNEEERDMWRRREQRVKSKTQPKLMGEEVKDIWEETELKENKGVLEERDSREEKVNEEEEKREERKKDEVVENEELDIKEDRITEEEQRDVKERKEAEVGAKEELDAKEKKEKRGLADEREQLKKDTQKLNKRGLKKMKKKKRRRGPLPPGESNHMLQRRPPAAPAAQNHHSKEWYEKYQPEEKGG